MVAKDWKLTEEDYYWKKKNGDYITILANDFGTDEHPIVVSKSGKLKTVAIVLGYSKAKSFVRSYIKKN